MNDNREIQEPDDSSEASTPAQDPPVESVATSSEAETGDESQSAAVEESDEAESPDDSASDDADSASGAEADDAARTDEAAGGSDADASGSGESDDEIDELFLSPDDVDAEEVEFPEESAAGVAPAPTAPAEPDPELITKIEGLEAERDDLKNRMLRTAADLDNFRKRSAREKQELRKYGIDRVVLELLPVLDNLERALEHGDKAADDGTAASIIDGVRMVHRQFVGALGKHGVAGFDSKGEMFDPQKHEAIQQIESPEHETGTILEEYQKGYYLHDRLIRPALVVVARRAEASSDEPSGEPVAGEDGEAGDEPAVEAEPQASDAEPAEHDSDAESDAEDAEGAGAASGEEDAEATPDSEEPVEAGESEDTDSGESDDEPAAN